MICVFVCSIMPDPERLWQSFFVLIFNKLIESCVHWVFKKPLIPKTGYIQNCYLFRKKVIVYWEDYYIVRPKPNLSTDLINIYSNKTITVNFPITKPTKNRQINYNMTAIITTIKALTKRKMNSKNNLTNNLHIKKYSNK